MILRIRELTEILNRASRAYYQEDREIITDLEYDKLYDELVALEKETGFTLSNSPTRKVGYEVVSALQKATHNTPMLSLDKTKSPEALAAFLGDNAGLLSWKLDGLTIVLHYQNGQLQQAVTRGNGTIGENVTHNAKVFTNIPFTVPYQGAFTVRGEAVIPFADFKAINAEETVKYKNPRNLCSGAVRQLNSEITASRRVYFYAFGIMPGADIAFNLKSEQLTWLADQGFELAKYEKVTATNVVDTLAQFKAKVATEPIATDGLVLTFDDIAYSEALGVTSKFPKDSLAFKWQDEIAETTLIDVEWNTSRTGLINPVAIFAPVDIEGSQVSRASLHNVSIFKSLNLHQGDTITVYKANMIIPQVAENLTQDENATPLAVPSTCQVCGSPGEIIGDPEALYCKNINCDAQIIQGLSHFVSRNAMNIAGLSEQTLEKFITQGFVSHYLDLFALAQHKNEIISIDGFGKRSYEKLMEAIETAKNIPLPNFIYALGIRHVGLSNAKLLCGHFKHNPEEIVTAAVADNYMEILLDIKGFGDAIAQSLHEYFADEDNRTKFYQALEILNLEAPTIVEDAPLAGLTFVITGDVTKFKNRKAMQGFIEENGGRVAGSVSAKTTALINNDSTSTSGKNKKAQDLNVAILTEDAFHDMYF